MVSFLPSSTRLPSPTLCVYVYWICKGRLDGDVELAEEEQPEPGRLFWSLAGLDVLRVDSI